MTLPCEYYKDRVLDTNPIAFWRLNEISGTVAHCEIDPNQDAEYYNTLLMQPGIGDGGFSVFTNGDDSYINIYTPAFENVFNGYNGSIMVWWKPEYNYLSNKKGGRIIEIRSNTGNDSLDIHSTGNNTIDFRGDFAGNSFYIIAENIFEYRWYCLIALWDNDKNIIRFYIDGELIGEKSINVDWSATTLNPTHTCIAAYNTVGTFVSKGWLANTAIWDRPLSEYEINNISEAQLLHPSVEHENFLLFDATLGLARILMDVHEGQIESSSENTITDSYILQKKWFANENEQGTIWFYQPERTIRFIVDQADTTLTFAPQVTNPPEICTWYSAAPPDFPRNLLFQSINGALAEIGPLINTKEIDITDKNKLEYDEIDDKIFNHKISAIYMARKDKTSWMLNQNWNQIELPEGKRALVFQEEYKPHYSEIMRVHYYEPVKYLIDSEDIINPSINKDALIWRAAVHALRWKLQRTEKDAPHYEDRYKEALAMAASLEVPKPKPMPRYSQW